MSSIEDLSAWWARLTIQDRVLGVVIVAQAGWLAYLCSRGWFYQDDFTLLSQAVHRDLSVAYLKEPFNGHLAPGVRLTFWVLAHTTRLHYGPTIVLRVVLQAIATLLLYRLLVIASASRTIGLGIAVVYCATPLLVPGTLWLASSVNLLTSQVCVLVVYLAHIRHARTGQLRWSALAGLALVVGVGFWEKTAVTSILLVIVSLGWLSTGSVLRRVYGLVRDWGGWLLTFGPLAAFTWYFFSHNYGTATYTLPAHAARHLIWLQWSHSLWPAVIGAPWRWLSAGQTYTSVANPRLVTVIAGQCAFVGLVIVGWRRSGWRGLLAWSLPLTSLVVGEVLVGLGRYAAFGDLPGLQFTYAFDLAVPTALAVALAFRVTSSPPLAAAAPTTEVEPAAVPDSERAAPPVPARRAPSRGWVRLAAGVAGVGLVVGSAVISALGWTDRWQDSPAQQYVGTILTGLHRIGPSANVFDTAVSPRVIPIISPNRNLSDLLALTDARVRFDRGLPQPLLVTDSGRLVPAIFVALAGQNVAPNSFCPTLVRGRTRIVVPLDPAVAPGAYFLRIEYFEQRPALVTVAVRGASGQPLDLRADPTVDFDQQLGVVLLPVAPGRPASVTFISDADATNVCMSKVSVGYPIAAQP